MTFVSDRPEGLPDFEDPPIDEVVIGLHFVPVPETPGALIGGYRERIKEGYPGVQYQPGLPPVLPGGTSMLQQATGVQFPLGVAPDSSGRVWLISKDESLLIQIQNDRFIHNWRHRGAEYPRFESLQETFWSLYKDFRSDATAMGLQLNLRQLEVTYVNWVLDNDMSPATYFAPSAVGNVDLVYATSDYEPMVWIGNYVITEDDVPLGRLTVQCQGGGLRVVGATAQRGSLLNLQFVAALEPGISDERVASLIALARKLIVQGFTNLTTSAAHERWRRIP
jgi:uncharacterized protein (TIGR04255 family)